MSFRCDPILPLRRSDKVTAALQRLDQGVRTVTDSDAYAAYLQAMGRFHTYSAHNVLLIWTQRPEETRVAGYRASRSVCEGPR